MNKGIIVVLVLLLLAGAVIAGIVLTRKSKYTKDTNVLVGAPLVTNNCGTNCTTPPCESGECCKTDTGSCYNLQDPPEGSTLHTLCDGDHKCNTPQVCIPGDDGQNRCYFKPINADDKSKASGPPGKGCVCWGRGTCEQSNEGCICDANSNLAGGQQRCQVCKDTYTWDSEAQKCMPPPNLCKNGGTPTPNTPNTPCSCLAGWTGPFCDQGEARWPDCDTSKSDCKPTGCAYSLQAKDGPPPSKGCKTLGVCPWGAGVQLEFDTSYHSGGCLSPGMAAKSAYTKFGCWIIPTITDGPAGLQGGPNCKFISYFNPTLVEKDDAGNIHFDRNSPDRVPLEKVTVTQGDCDAGWKAGHVTAHGTVGDDIPTCEGSWAHDLSGQVSIGPPHDPNK